MYACCERDNDACKEREGQMTLYHAMWERERRQRSSDMRGERQGGTERGGDADGGDEGE